MSKKKKNNKPSKILTLSNSMVSLKNVSFFQIVVDNNFGQKNNDKKKK